MKHLVGFSESKAFLAIWNAAPEGHLFWVLRTLEILFVFLLKYLGSVWNKEAIPPNKQATAFYHLLKGKWVCMISISALKNLTKRFTVNSWNASSQLYFSKEQVQDFLGWGKRERLGPLLDKLNLDIILNSSNSLSFTFFLLQCSNYTTFTLDSSKL